METSSVGIVTPFTIHGNKYYNDHSTVNFNSTSHTNNLFSSGKNEHHIQDKK